MRSAVSPVSCRLTRKTVKKLQSDLKYYKNVHFVVYMCKSVVDVCVCVCVSICGCKVVGLRVHVFGSVCKESVSVWKEWHAITRCAVLFLTLIFSLVLTPFLQTSLTLDRLACCNFHLRAKLTLRGETCGECHSPSQMC